MMRTFLIALLLLLAPTAASAATLVTTVSQASVAPGDTFTARIAVNAGGVAINNAEGTLRFPANLLSVSSVSKGGSIFTIWVEEPSYSNSAGTVSFNGGVPNPGYSGASGTVLTVTFVAKAAGTASLTFSGTAVRANDGNGTDVITGAYGADVAVRAATPTAPASTPATPSTDTAAPTSAPASSVGAEGPGRVVVTSSTHPRQDGWYSASDAVFSWALPKGADAVQLIVDRDDAAAPSVTYDPAIRTKEVTDLDDGTWYFRMRARADGAWGAVSTYQLNVDTAPPRIATHEFTYDEGKRALLVTAEASDAASGVAGYELRVDEDDPVVLPADAFSEGAYALTVRRAGAHTATLTAIDEAGNRTEVTGEFVAPESALYTPVWSVGDFAISLIDLLATALLIALAALAVAVAALMRRSSGVPRGVERDVHRGFVLFRTELVKNLKLLERARAKRPLTNEEVKLHKSMLQNLGELEEYVENLLRKPK